METKAMIVTPDMAHKWLANNPNNRRVKKSYVKILAGAMERGEWELNGESIKFNKRGELLDGQHRLTAVVQARVPIQTVVVDGLGDVFGSIDTGSKRTISDVLGVRGEKNTRILSAVCKFFYQAYHNNYKNRPTNKEAVKVLEENPGIRDSVGFIIQYQHFKGISPTTMAFFHYLGSQMPPWKQREVEEFIEKVFTGENCSKGDPALTLRNRLMRAASDGGTRFEETKVWIWKALVAYLNGYPLNRIKIAADEVMPDWATMLEIVEIAGSN